MEGDQHKMREALELAITIGDWCCAQTDDPLECCEFSCANQVEPHGEAGADCPWKKIRAALAAPPRVCDVNTLESLSDFVEKTILTSDLLKHAPEIVKRIVMASVRTALSIAYEPAKETRSEDLRTMRE